MNKGCINEGSKSSSKKTRCPCGSGKRYVKCCKARNDTLEDLIAEHPEMIRRHEIARERYISNYGHLKVPIGFDVGGRKVVRIGDMLYRQEGEGPYNVANAIHDYALWFFGEERLAVEEAKPFEHRHPAIQWLHAHYEMSEREEYEHQNGYAAAWHRFAYDLFTISDNAKLQNELKRKLLNNRDFQAGRFELKVAALCATAGFDLSFENERDRGKRHPEFFGVDRNSGARIAVEAKSRHRKGVLGFAGGSSPIAGSELGVRNCLIDAYKKQPEAPFYVFVDCNLPPRTEDSMRRWEDELYNLMQDLDAEGYASPCPANAVFFMNDPSHYVGCQKIGAEGDMLWVRQYTANEPRVEHPESDIVERLLTAHAQRVASPGFFFEAD
jgi:hypothetical protein